MEMNSVMDTKLKIVSIQPTLEKVLGKGDSEMSFKYPMISTEIVANIGREK